MPSDPDAQPLRIVSLVPSATETVFALGLGDRLVGRSHACDFPRAALDLPALTQPHLETHSSRGVHDEVRARLESGLAIYALDLERLRDLRPTHLLVQDQCSVCAVSPADLEQALGAWLGEAPRLVRLAPHDLSDAWRDIRSIGLALGRAEAADRLCESLSFRLSDLAEATGSTPSRTRPKVACIEWLDPIMIAGHWVPELVRLAGGDPLLSRVGGPSRTVDLRALDQAAPDVVVVQACGFDLDESLRQWQALPELAKALLALRDTRGRPVPIAVTDGSAFFNRPGPRLVDSAELLGRILHPESGSPEPPPDPRSCERSDPTHWTWLRAPASD